MSPITLAQIQALLFKLVEFIIQFLVIYFAIWFAGKRLLKKFHS